jgi:glc operon protein GlcG
MLLLASLVVTDLAHGQTLQVQTISLDGARAVLHAAEHSAQQLSAPSSVAVVDAAGDLILFEQMQGARPVGIDLAIGKARSAARYRETTQMLEETISAGRPAAITSGMIQMDGGVPIQVGGMVVGAVGVSGLVKTNDVQITQTAAAAAN